MRPPMEKVVAAFAEQTGVPVRMTSADSGTLLTQIRETRRGDVYVCHDPFGTVAEREGFTTDVLTVAVLRPVIVVPKGNPKGIKGLDDLGRPGLRLALPDPQYATAGVVLQAMLEKAGLREEVDANAVTRARESSMLANAVALGTGNIDAAVCWDAIARQHPNDLTVIPIAPDYNVDAVTSASGKVYQVDSIRVTACVLKFTSHSKEVKTLLDLCISEEGRRIFSEAGFTLVEPAPEVAKSGTESGVARPVEEP